MTLLVGFSPLSAATILGQIGTNGTSLDGHVVPSGTTLLSDSVVATGDHPAIVNLINGQTLLLGGQSKALFEKADAGLAIHVQAGTLAFNAGADETVTLAPNSLLLLNESGQVQEGTRVNRADVGLCELRDADTGEYFTDPADILLCQNKPGNEQCAWDRKDVSGPEVQGYLDHGALGLDDEDSKLDDRCNVKTDAGRKNRTSRGLSRGQWALIGAGGAAVGYVIYDEEADTDVASPVTP